MSYMYYNINSFEWCGFARTQIRMHVMRHRHRRRHVDTTTTRALQLLRFSLSVCFTVFERKLKANKNQICNSHIPLVRSRMIQTNTCCIDDGPSSMARSTKNTITRSRRVAKLERHENPPCETNECPKPISKLPGQGRRAIVVNQTSQKKLNSLQ